ncbi:MAG: ABC transporter substrate-binding protein [Clostridia bacterium]|nr:ABC transporter substrate-binding protein [Clostridia bacterium]
MKRVLAFALILVLMVGVFAGCGKGKGNEVNNGKVSEDGKKGGNVRITAIAGPTGVGMVNLMQNSAGKKTTNTYTFDVVSDPTQAVAAITRGEADIAAVPTNLAATLYKKTEGKVRVLAVNTLGVLHILENGESIKSIKDLKGKTIYTDAKNKGANPEYILRYLLEQNGLKPDENVRIEFAADLDAAMASGEAKIALVPEPKASTYMMQNKSIRRALNVTEEWNKVSDEDCALMMGCVIARSDFVEKNPDAIALFLEDYMTSIQVAKSNVEATATLCETYKIIPKAAVARQALPNCGLTYVTGNLMKKQLSAYLKVMFDYDPTVVGGALPKDDFYYAG